MASRIDLPEAFGSQPFTTAAARASGVSRHQLERPSITRLTRGVHLAGEINHVRTKLRGLTLVLPADAVFSCETTALARGLHLPDVGRSGRDGLVHTRSTKQIRRSGVRAHRGPVPAHVERNGLRLTTPIETCLVLAMHVDDGWLLACGDAIVKRDYATPQQLVDAVDAAEVRRGLPRARRIAPLVRADVRSPMESILRLLLIRAGLPEPMINRNVFDEGGGWIACPDLSYPERSLSLEYDGEQHLIDPRQWETDIGRRHNLEDLGWTVRIITAADLFLRPARLTADMLALWKRLGS
jgi:hypothetical protein